MVVLSTLAAGRGRVRMESLEAEGGPVLGMSMVVLKGWAGEAGRVRRESWEAEGVLVVVSVRAGVVTEES